jgi:hypothetical protein
MMRSAHTFSLRWERQVRRWKVRSRCGVHRCCGMWSLTQYEEVIPKAVGIEPDENRLETLVAELLGSTEVVFLSCEVSWLRLTNILVV